MYVHIQRQAFERTHWFTGFSKELWNAVDSDWESPKYIHIYTVWKNFILDLTCKYFIPEEGWGSEGNMDLYILISNKWTMNSCIKS